jgi:hypothetical protein
LLVDDDLAHFRRLADRRRVFVVFNVNVETSVVTFVVVDVSVVNFVDEDGLL